MKSPLVRLVAMLSWLITALAAINIGLIPFGYNVFASEVMQTTLAQFVIPLHYVIGVAGVLSLLMFFKASFGSGCGCGCDSHKAK